MSFKNLLDQLRKHPFQELRAHSDNYFEAVVSMSKLVGVEDSLIAYFGPPLKSAGIQPSAEAHHFSKSYGGIRQSQTMYFRKKDDGHIVAFLWPWKCGTLVTLKVILEMKPEPPMKTKRKIAWLKDLWKAFLKR